MKQFTIEELIAVQENQQYKYLALFDSAGKPIIPFNPNSIKASERLREIETRLKSQGLKDGLYIVKCKNSVGKTVSTDDYPIFKGENLACGPDPVVPIQHLPAYSPEVLTYDQALKLNIEVERYKLENQALKKEIVSLNAQIAELEDNQAHLSEEPEPSLMDNANSFLQNAMQFVAPLLDQHFALKQQQLGLEAMKLQRLGGMPMRPQAPRANPETSQKETLEAFIMSYQDDPEKYEAMANLYNTALSQEDFLKNLQEWDIDVYNELKNGRKA
jgi:hypothetical protein